MEQAKIIGRFDRKHGISYNKAVNVLRMLSKNKKVQEYLNKNKDEKRG